MAMMISKFHKLIQSKVVWTAFAILISVAFVGFYTGAKSSGNTDQAKELKKPVGRLWGEDVSRVEFGTIRREVYALMDLNSLMQYNRGLPGTEAVEEAITQQAWVRLATIKKAQQMGLTVTKEQVDRSIQTFPFFLNPQTGVYDERAKDYILNLVNKRYRMTPQDFVNVLTRNVLIQKATSTAGTGANVTEDEIKKAFHLYNDKITVVHAALPRSLAEEVEITEEIAKEYYLRNLDQFVAPEKRVVKSVQYHVADYTNSVEVTDELIATAYESQKQRFVKPETATNAVPEFMALEEVKDEIAADLTLMLANQAAFNEADQLVAALAAPGATFEGEVEKLGLAIKPIPPFTAAGRVIGADPTAPIARTAFGLVLDDTHYYSDPIRGRDTVYVLSLVKINPAFQQQFDAAKNAVIESAKIAEGEKAYVEKAASVHAEVEAALNSGTPFADATTKYNLELQTTEPFSLSEPLEGGFSQQLMAATIQFDAGTLADLVDGNDEFLIAYVADKEIADEAATLPSVRDDLSRGLRAEKARNLAQAWQAGLLDDAGFEDLTIKSTSDES